MQFTSEQIQAYKAKHGEVFEFSFPTGESCLLRKPTRQELSYISAVKDPIKMSEQLLINTWIEGDEVILRDDRLFMGILPKMEELLRFEEATVKKH